MWCVCWLLVCLPVCWCVRVCLSLSFVGRRLRLCVSLSFCVSGRRLRLSRLVFCLWAAALFCLVPGAVAAPALAPCRRADFGCCHPLVCRPLCLCALVSLAGCLVCCGGGGGCCGHGLGGLAHRNAVIDSVAHGGEGGDGGARLHL